MRARSGGLEPPERVECGFYLAAGYVALSSTGAARRELRARARRRARLRAAAVHLAQGGGAVPRRASRSWRTRRACRRCRPSGAATRWRCASPPRAPAGAPTAWCSGAGAGSRAGARRRCATRASSLVTDVPVEQTGTLEYFADGRAPGGVLQAGAAEQPLELPVAVGPTLSLAAGAAAAGRGAPGEQAVVAVDRAWRPSAPPAPASGSTSRCARNRRRPTPSSTSRCTDAPDVARAPGRARGRRCRLRRRRGGEVASAEMALSGSGLVAERHRRRRGPGVRRRQRRLRPRHAGATPLDDAGLVLVAHTLFTIDGTPKHLAIPAHKPLDFYAEALPHRRAQPHAHRPRLRRRQTLSGSATVSISLGATE